MKRICRVWSKYAANVSIAAMLLLWGVTLGCGGGDRGPSDAPPRLRSVVALYNMMKSSTGRPPNSEQEFKEFIASKGSLTLDKSGVANADELLISDRDGEPYVIVYGTRPKGMHPDLVAYENVGVDGKRLVGFGLGIVELADESKFSELAPAPTTP
jgi:hypothetical protein